MYETTGPVEVLERHESGDDVVQLQRRGEHLEVIANGVFLMATYNTSSAALLVRAACDMSTRPRRVLVGGLGVGYSLAEALRTESVESVVVVEIDPHVIRWNREHFAPYTGGALDDPRVELVHADLRDWLATTSQVFDVACLDTDNGPDWLVRPSNRRLYDRAGLDALKRHVADGGAVSFWSAARSGRFESLLRATFARAVRIDVPQERGEPDRLYVCQGERTVGSVAGPAPTVVPHATADTRWTREEHEETAMTSSDDHDVDDDAQPGPEHTAGERTQQDAGLDGGAAEADRGERVGDDED